MYLGGFPDKLYFFIFFSGLESGQAGSPSAISDEEIEMEDRISGVGVVSSVNGDSASDDNRGQHRYNFPPRVSGSYSGYVAGQPSTSVNIDDATQRAGSIENLNPS